MGPPGVGCMLGNAAVELQPELPRDPGPLGYGFDVDPADTPGPAGAEGLHGRLLGRKSDREVPPGAPIRLADGDLLAGEHPAGESIAGPRQHPLDALDLDDIDSTADDHDPPAPAFREE